MNINPFVKISSILVFFSTLIFPISGLPASPKDALTPIDSTLSLRLEQVQNGIFDSKFWVVRVYIDNRQQVNDLATWIEPWEVNYKEGYLVMGVDSNDYNLLLAQGYRVEIDPDFTALFNQPLENLPGQVSGIPGYPCYRTVEETFAVAAQITADYPQLATWLDIGNSWEKNNLGGSSGFDIQVLRLTNAAITGDKPKLFLMAAIHAREYATTELITRFAEYLVSNYDIDPDVTWLLDYNEIHLLLQSNPDGRKQAESGIYWRKNTNENYCSPTSQYRGADLNRNFDFQWGCCEGSSSYVCDEVYRGPSPASEPEVQAIQNYVRSIFPDQRVDNISSPAPEDATGVFLDIHSYGELVLWPWGFTNSNAPNNQALQTLGRKFAYFNRYDPAQSYELYPTDGTTDDFAYGELGVAAYTFELGTTFFQGCEDFENTILPDNFPALIYAAKVSRTPYRTPSGPEVIQANASPATITSGEVITLSAQIDDTRYRNNNGAEAVQNVAAAEYYLDLPPWEEEATPHLLTPADGVFDAPDEEVIASFNTSGLTVGRHSIFMRGQDTNGNWGAISAVFMNIEPPNALYLEKTASTWGVVPQEIFTYTLEAQLALTGTNTYTLSLTDNLPDEVAIITDSIRVNGIVNDQLYDPGFRQILYETSGNFTETYQIEITFQAQVGEEIPFWTRIENRLNGQATINGELIYPDDISKSSILVISPDHTEIYLPVIIHQN